MCSLFILTRFFFILLYLLFFEVSGQLSPPAAAAVRPPSPRTPMSPDGRGEKESLLPNIEERGKITLQRRLLRRQQRQMTAKITRASSTTRRVDDGTIGGAPTVLRLVHKRSPLQQPQRWRARSSSKPVQLQHVFDAASAGGPGSEVRRVAAADSLSRCWRCAAARKSRKVRIAIRQRDVLDQRMASWNDNAIHVQASLRGHLGRRRAMRAAAEAKLYREMQMQKLAMWTQGRAREKMARASVATRRATVRQESFSFCATVFAFLILFSNYYNYYDIIRG